MGIASNKQAVLKPQDLLVALKISIAADGGMPLRTLATQLHMSISEVHAATKRAELSRLISKSENGLVAIRSSLEEFLLHGVRYCFPAIQAGIVRGMPTGFAGPTLSQYFKTHEQILQVWPDSNGTERGVSFQPLYPTVPAAARLDPELYDVLTLIDAIRGGAARERELAKEEIVRRIK